MKWISTKDRLPSDPDNAMNRLCYLTLCEFGTAILWYCGNNIWRDEDSCRCEVNKWLDVEIKE